MNLLTTRIIYYYQTYSPHTLEQSVSKTHKIKFIKKRVFQIKSGAVELQINLYRWQIYI